MNLNCLICNTQNNIVKEPNIGYFCPNCEASIGTVFPEDRKIPGNFYPLDNIIGIKKAITESRLYFLKEKKLVK